MRWLIRLARPIDRGIQRLAIVPPSTAIVWIRSWSIDASPPASPLRRAFDYTHLGPQGAEFFATMVAGEIRSAVPALGRHIDRE